MSLLIPEVRNELAPDKPSPSEVLRALRALYRRTLITVEHMDANPIESPEADALWERLAEDYRDGSRDADTMRQALEFEDLWFKPTDAGYRHAIAIGAMIPNDDRSS